MKNKTLSLVSLSILTVLIMTAFASAISLSPNITILDQDGGSFTLTVSEATPSTTVDFTISVIPQDSDGTEIDFTPSFPSTITVNSSGDGSLNIDYTTIDFNFEFGETYSFEVIATESPAPENNDTTSLTFEQTPFYDGDNYGELEISNIDFNTIKGFGDDEDYWYPLDEVEVTFDVDNDGDWDIEDIKVEICLWDEDAEKCILDEDDMDIDDDKFDLDSGDDKTVTITLDVDPDKLTEGNNDYTFYIKAVGEIDDNDAGIYDGDETGDSDSESIEIITNDDFVILDDIEFSETASCGSELQITADVWNIGDDDQDDVYVIIYNKELGINKKVTIGDIDALEDEKLDITITLPTDADEKQYDLIFRVYDEDNDLYENDQDDTAEFFAPITLDSCSTVAPASVSSNQLSEAKAGQELEIKLTITNADTKTNTFNLALNGYSSWASLISMDKTSVTLNAGESQDVLIKLKIDSDVSGEQSFYVDVTEGNKVLSQLIPVTIEQSSLFPNLNDLFNSSNWYLYLIGALNLILVLIIIIVAVRISKKKE